MTATLTCFGQNSSVYPFLKDDTTIRVKLYDRAVESKNQLINALSKENRKDYQKIYEARFEGVAEILKSSFALTEATAHAYLQTILKKIIDANPELKNLEIRMVFTRDIVPNAYSMGEGTIFVNAGFLVYLDNEGQLAFALCHELAHLYLDHSNKKIRNMVDLAKSDEIKKEAKQISKQQYGAGQKFEELIKKYSFLQGRHSRDFEAEADRIGFSFMKRTGYDIYQAKTCLQLLDIIDDTALFKPVKLEEIFQFDEYTFKKKWTLKESSIFASLNGDNNILTKAEKDSLKTHPDCLKRIELLKDSLSSVSVGKKFMVDEQLFRKLQTDFIAEITEQQYKFKNLGYYLYLNLQLLQKEEYKKYAIYSIVKTLNSLYEYQKNHQIGTVTDKETRYYPEDYNLLLRMLDRLKLDEIANLSFYFAKKYGSILSGNKEFEEVYRKAEKLKSEN